LKGMSKLQDIFVSVVVPVRNDVEIIGPFLHALVQLLDKNYTNYEILIVESGSIDGTSAAIKAELLKLECIRFMALTKEYSIDTCIFAGLENSIGDFVVVLIPSSDPLELIVPSIKICQEKRNLVFGESTTAYANPLALRSIVGFLFHFFTNRFLSLTLPRASTYFRVFDRSMVTALAQIRGRHPMVKRYGSAVGRNAQPIQYQPLANLQRWRRESLMDRVSYGFDILWTSGHQAIAPLIKLTVALSFLLGILASYLADWQPVEVLRNFQLFLGVALVGLVGHYLSRTTEEVQGVPPYFVDETAESNVLLRESRPNVQ